MDAVVRFATDILYLAWQTGNPVKRRARRPPSPSPKGVPDRNQLPRHLWLLKRWPLLPGAPRLLKGRSTEWIGSWRRFAPSPRARGQLDKVQRPAIPAEQSVTVNISDQMALDDSNLSVHSAAVFIRGRRLNT